MEGRASLVPDHLCFSAQSFAIDGRLKGVTRGQLEFAAGGRAAGGPAIGGRRGKDAMNAVDEVVEQTRPNRFNVTVVIL